MTWPFLIALLVALTLTAAAAFHRRTDLARQRRVLDERAAMAARDLEAPALRTPVVDLARCLGCGSCISACPEHGVLALVHGQAAVVNPALCVGHGHCATECPVDAVTIETPQEDSRHDLPVLEPSLQAVGRPGLWLAGEITSRALIRGAVEQGVEVAARIADELGSAPKAADDTYDVVIIGAGPAGLACALASRQRDLRFVVLDEEPDIGGAVARYPRRKLVLTEPIELPLAGRLPQREYLKEELLERWQEIATRHELPFRGGLRFLESERQQDGRHVVRTTGDEFRARHVVLAVGRRGSPRRLGVPGEELPHISYGLVDARSWSGRPVVVVGGGDSAIEAALALAAQPGTEVTIVYRQDAFFRIRPRNRDRVQEAVANGTLAVRYRATVAAIAADTIEIRAIDGTATERLAADAVFVLIGGETPVALLERSGVSFDPEQRPATRTAADAADKPLGGLGTSLVLLVLATAFLIAHLDYYALTTIARAADPQHALLRPDASLGLWFGIVGTIAIVANLAYLARREQWRGLRFGSLASWMSVHVATGIGAFLLTALHAAFAPRATAGGHAFWVLAVLLVTGAIGRWFYAWLPRTANGRELELTALRDEMTACLAGRRCDFSARAIELTRELLVRRQWRSTFVGRVVALLGLQWDLWLTLRRLRREADAAGVDPDERASIFARIRRMHRIAIATAHLEDLRAVLGTWRWLHRWLALLMVLLVLIHVVVAWLYGAFTFGGAS